MTEDSYAQLWQTLPEPTREKLRRGEDIDATDAQTLIGGQPVVAYAYFESNPDGSSWHVDNVFSTWCQQQGDGR